MPKNIVLFIPTFDSYMLTKDVGQILLGFIDLGHRVTVYTFSSSVHPDANIPTMLISKADAKRASFWKEQTTNQTIDFILCYTWLSYTLTPIIKALVLNQIKTAIKLDSDGRLGYPLRPSYLRGAGYWSSVRDFIYWSIRSVQWIFPIGFFHRNRLQQIALADTTIIESPLAKENLTKILSYWNMPGLSEKIRVIPNPVSQDIIDAPLPTHKEQRIISIGRWNDRSKNREVLKKILTTIPRLFPQYSFSVIGSHSSYFSQLKNVAIFKPLSHALLVQKHLLNSQILFIPSRWEGFNLSASEAVCCGMTLVASPLEYAHFLTHNNSGTVAKKNTYSDQKEALLYEISAWEENKRDPHAIATYWRSVLNRKAIAASILK